MMDRWQERITDALESAGWTARYLENGEWEIGRYSDAGEDFSFPVTADSPEKFASEVRDYCNSFDPEEHAVMWYGANRGEPSSLRVLLADADSIEAALEDLAIHVTQAAAHEKQGSINGSQEMVSAAAHALKEEGFTVHSYEENESISLEVDFFDENSATYQTLSVSIFADEAASPDAWHEAFSGAVESWFEPSFVGDEGFALTQEQAEAIQNNVLSPLIDVVYRAVLQESSRQEPCHTEAGRSPLVRDWYIETYPSDELGTRISPSLTFDRALSAVALGGGFYDALGVGDSLVRERVFKEISNRNDVSYGDVYDAWLNGESVKQKSSHSLASEAKDMKTARDALGQSAPDAPGGRDER